MSVGSDSPIVHDSDGGQRSSLAPPVLKPDSADAIPPELRKFRRWVCWRYETRDGKPTKVPIRPDGAPAKSNDPNTWSTWEECWVAMRRYRDLGIGLMLGDGIVGIDLDHVRDAATGALEDWASEIVDEIRSYTEASPSGTGVHILCLGKLPAGRRRKGQVEIYSDGRYFTVTGRPLRDYGLENRTAELEMLHKRIFGGGGGARNGRGAASGAHGAIAEGDLDLDDRALVQRALAAKDGDKFRRLWDGQWQDEYDSQSEADLALCCLLAFWTGGDASRIDRLFRQSGLMRQKWERADYRERTINEALERTLDRYQPAAPGRRRRAAARASGAVITMTKPEAAPAPITPELAERLVRFNLTDSGNAERLVLRHGDHIRYCHPQRTWWIWTGRRWEPDRNGAVMEMAKAVARELYYAAAEIPDPERKKAVTLWAIRSESTERKRAALISAQSEPGIPILPEHFDTDEFLLNCLNGTVDLRTGELRPHSRSDYITRLCPVEYHPGARSELWERFLHEACGGDRELIEFLQRAAGYTLTGSTAEEKMFFVHGPAAAGKSTFLEAIKAVLGDYAKTADFETFVLRREAGAVRNDIAELAGRRFVVSIEVDEGRRLAEGLVKMLTGGDTVRARFLYQESFEFAPQFKLWLAANHPPRVRHDDSAMWRRILRIPFTHVIPAERRDPTVKARLRDVRESGPAILAWAVEGCLRWQEEGLGVPKLVLDATQEYRLEMDPLADFIRDCCVCNPKAWTPTAKLRAAYEQYCRETGERRVLGAKEFTEALKSHGFEPLRRFAGGRGWQGIGLLTDAEEGT